MPPVALNLLKERLSKSSSDFIRFVCAYAISRPKRRRLIIAEWVHDSLDEGTLLNEEGRKLVLCTSFGTDDAVQTICRKIVMLRLATCCVILYTKIYFVNSIKHIVSWKCLSGGLDSVLQRIEASRTIANYIDEVKMCKRNIIMPDQSLLTTIPIQTESSLNSNMLYTRKNQNQNKQES